MSKESSHNGDITGNTYTDLGAVTGEAYDISLKSRRLARETIGNSGYEDRIRQRCSIAVGDFTMADLIRFRSDPVQSGLQALAAGAPVITDIRMVQVGIQKKGHHSDILCALDFDEGDSGTRDNPYITGFYQPGREDYGRDRRDRKCSFFTHHGLQRYPWGIPPCTGNRDSCRVC